MIEKAKINEIVSKIALHFDPDKIILFGSYASGKATNDSDLDLLIIQETELPRHKRSFDIQKSLKGSMIPMDILVYTIKEFEEERNQKNSFLNSLIQNSEILYERN
jgi:predicted nucleotidyltransferase